MSLYSETLKGRSHYCANAFRRKKTKNMDFHRYGLQNVAYDSENVWKRIEMHYSVHDMLRRFQQLLLSSEIENWSFYEESLW